MKPISCGSVKRLPQDIVVYPDFGCKTASFFWWREGTTSPKEKNNMAPA
jgi:hypothetical protein